MARDIGALQTSPGASIGALYPASGSSQNIDPGGLASAFAAGAPTLKYDQDISPGGLASGFAAGSPTVFFPNNIGPIGLPSGFATGVPTVGSDTIIPTGLPSEFAAGEPTLNVAQLIIPTGLASGFAAGAPSLVPAQVIDPTGLPSAFAAGSPYVAGGPTRIVPTGLASGFKAGYPTVQGPSGGLKLYLGGVDATRYLSLAGVANPGLDAQTVAQPMQITSQTLGRWTAVFDIIDLNLSFYPELDQTFLLVENGAKIMSGGLVSVQLDRWEGPYGQPMQGYHCTAQDWSAICDRRVVNATYPAGTDIASIVLDIWTNVLCNPNEGITANNVPEIGGPLGLTDSTEVFNFQTVTQAFDQLATDTGCIWWIDVNADLHFVDYSMLPTCNYSLGDGTVTNWRALSATGTLVNYRNVQYIVSNLTAVPGVAQQQQGGLTPGQPGYGGPVITETYTIPQAAAVARGFLLGSIITNFPMAQITAFTVNGVAQPVYSGLLGYNFEQAWWYFPGFPYLYPPSTQNDAPAFPTPPVTSPYPTDGDVVVISYVAISSSQSAVVVPSGNGPLTPDTPGAAGTWGSGIFENVLQIQNINLQGDLNAIAAAVLAIGDIPPVIVQFESDEGYAQVGQTITIDIPLSFLESSTQFTITNIQATVQPAPEGLAYGSMFRWVVTAQSGQDIGNSVKWFERLLSRTENPLPIQQFGDLTFILAPGGSLAAGVPPNNPVPLTSAGALVQAYVICGTPPQEQNLVIDILDNGSSILSSPLVVPADSDLQVLTMAFATPGLTVAIGDLLSVSVSYQVIGTSPTPAANVTVFVQWTTAGLPAGQIQPGVYQTYVE